MGRVSDRAPHTRSPTRAAPHLSPRSSLHSSRVCAPSSSARPRRRRVPRVTTHPPATATAAAPTPLTPRFPPLATQTHVDREAQEAEINLNRERAAAEHWRAQHERETEAHDSVQV